MDSDAPMSDTCGMPSRAQAPEDAATSTRTAGTPSLMEALRERTRALHVEAERSGVIHELLQGRADRHAYAVLLRNLLPVYREMELGLERHRDSPGLGEIAQPAVYRSAALESDLDALCGPTWQRMLPQLPAAGRYASLVAAAARGDGTRLIGHAYVRYLGDLSGGQILRRLLARSLSLQPQQLTFYEFADIAKLDEFKAGYRAALDRAALAVRDGESIIAEAEAAFRLNIEISIAIQGASTI
jgi:heme oxygenase (biliverdin-producing, ferredoxin)